MREGISSVLGKAEECANGPILSELQNRVKASEPRRVSEQPLDRYSASLRPHS